MRSAPVVFLSPAQFYEPRTELTFTLGEIGLVRDDSSLNDGSTIVSLYVFVYDVHITDLCHIAIRVSYETLFHTIYGNVNAWLKI